MASLSRDLTQHKCYRPASGGNIEELKKLLREEKSKNPKRSPYFFSASKQLPGKFVLCYLPGSKPGFEYMTVTPDGFRYRNRVHNSVNGLLKWFKEHYREPVPKPVQTSSSAAASVGGSHIPSHITRNLDYSQLQAAVNTAHQHSSSITSNTPYTPTHLAYSNTPTPQYGGQQQQFGGGFGGQGQPNRGNTYQRARGGQQFIGSGQFGGGGPGGTWRTGGGWAPQTPGRTPAYTPSQTPHSVSSLYGTPPHLGRGQLTPHHRHEPGTPVRDE